MPAPTALLKPIGAAENVPLPGEDHDEELLLHASAAAFPNTNLAQPQAAGEDTEMIVDEEGRSKFAPAKDDDTNGKVEFRKVGIPPHRFAYVKANWSKIYTPLVENLKLQCRMNIAKKAVELRSSKFTINTGAIQQGADFVQAIALGFEVDDAIALLRLDSLYIQTFEIKDIKTLNLDAQSRAIGRIAGKDGKTKFSIENATKTRIVVAGSKISILGGFENIGMARESIVSLVLGKQPGKVYNDLRTIASRMKERF